MRVYIIIKEACDEWRCVKVSILFLHLFRKTFWAPARDSSAVFIRRGTLCSSGACSVTNGLCYLPTSWTNGYQRPKYFDSASVHHVNKICTLRIYRTIILSKMSTLCRNSLAFILRESAFRTLVHVDFFTCFWQEHATGSFIVHRHKPQVVEFIWAKCFKFRLK